jgi:glycosyltransferase involved in cell wall biosynthesis
MSAAVKARLFRETHNVVMIRALLIISGRMYGGGQRVVLDLLEESQKWMNGTVDLCLLGGPEATMPPVRAEVVQYDGRYNRPLTLWRTSRRLRNVMEGLKPDLVHSHGWDAAMIGTLALSNLVLPHVIHIHTTDVWLESRQLKHQLRRMLTRWMLNRPDTTVVAVSDGVRRHWCRTLGVPLRSIRVILNGVDTKRFQPLSNGRRPNGAVTLGIASRLQSNKGLEDLVDALAILARDNLRPTLVIAGEGKLRGALEAQIERLGLRQQVKFLGFVNDMERFYQSIDVGVLASPREGLPLFVLEAMSCGVPVVATDVGGTKEALRDGIDGFVVPAHEPAALAAALRKLIQDPDDRQQKGSNARTRIEADFSRTVFFEQVSRLYQEMLEQAMPHYPKSHVSKQAEEKTWV